jgi:hypothetical protein
MGSFVCFLIAASPQMHWFKSLQTNQPGKQPVHPISGHCLSNRTRENSASKEQSIFGKDRDGLDQAAFFHRRI